MQPNPIEAVAARIQRIRPEVRWIHAQQSVILAQVLRSNPGRDPWGVLRLGAWGKRADRLVAISDAVKLGGLVTGLANLALLIGLFAAQYRTQQKRFQGLLFVGLGALRETLLVEELKERFGLPVSVADETNLSSFFCFRRIGLFALAREWWQLWAEIRMDLHPTHAQGVSRRDCLTYLMRGGHQFAYLRAWFRQHIRATGSSRIAFTSASVAAFAAVSAGAETIYLEHGFQCHSLVYPDFHEICCFNRYEADHFRARLPNARVAISAPSLDLLPSERLAVIVGDYGQETDEALASSFLDWAKEVSLPVVVRPHPQHFSRFWEQWRHLKNLTISRDQCDFTTFLRTHRPRVLVTWHSTTLFDALVYGIVPVTLARDDMVADHSVFPIRKVALTWPDQKPLIQSIIDDAGACLQLAVKKYEDVVGVTPQKSQREADNHRASATSVT